MVKYDYIIIGAGIAGLYSGLKLINKSSQTKILILEKNDYIGGRILMDKFCGKDVIIGANSGRYEKDKNLISLLKKYNINIKPEVREVSYLGFEPINILEYVNNMKQQKNKLDFSKTFKQNFIKLYGKNTWDKFVLSNGYTEFEDADVNDMLDTYFFNKSISGFKYFPVDWELLKEKMVDELKEKNVSIIKNIDVKNIIKLNKDDIKIETVNSKTYSKKVFETKNIIIATNIYGLNSLYKNPSYHKYITSQIRCQTAIRLYAKVSDPINNLKSNYTITNNFLQKIMTIGDNIYMISASDNRFAENINKMNINNLKNKIEDLFDVNVCKIAKYYWPCAFHYFKPLKYFKSRQDFLEAAQNPEENIFVVGEAVALQHWWVEGALESVNNLF